MPDLWLLWLVGPVLGLFAGLEVRALYDRRPGTTLSAKWWAVRHSVTVRVLVFGPLAWVAWHLLSPWDGRTGGWDDVLAVVVGAGLALAVRYPRRDGA